VLSFDAELVLDGRSLPRPVNYGLVRIIPLQGTSVDPNKRPFIVFDPRAGHGPGIGGMKHDSEIGVALAAGHPCYFVGFLPDPVPGQTIEDVCEAEARFVEEVVKRHPNYSTVMRPAVRAMVTETSAELMRRSHPNRLRFEMLADENPFMRPVAGWAEAVRENRRPVNPDNPFLAFEHMMSDMIASGLEMWGRPVTPRPRRSSSTPTALRFCRRWSVCAPTKHRRAAASGAM
jgi:Protein of unknown function (DUF3141)